MSEIHLVVGAGRVGSHTARLLAVRGHHVRLVTRAGTGLDLPGVERVALDAADRRRLAELSRGATAIYNCANPPYHRWSTDWPPLAASLLAAAESSGAVLATVSNLYAYGKVDRPMSPDLPAAPVDPKGSVRDRMWQDAHESHRVGRVRALEVRASDYLDGGDQSAVARLAPALLAGRRLRTVGSLDQPHSWSTTWDTAATAVAAAASPEAHGAVWHVPTNPPRTQRQALTELARVAGVVLPPVSTSGATTLRVVGLVNPTVRELLGTLYQFTAPFVIDDRRTRDHLGLEPEDWDGALARVVAGARTSATAGRAA